MLLVPTSWGTIHVTGPYLLGDYPCYPHWSPTPGGLSMLPTLVPNSWGTIHVPALVPNSWGTHALSLPAPSQVLNISPFILFFLFEAGSLYVTLAVLELCV